MEERALIAAVIREHGAVLFCGGHESAEPALALAFVRFVRALPEERIHPDDLAENCAGNFETEPRWSAEALEYVFSDRSEVAHAELVAELYATLSAAERARAWSSVRAQLAGSELLGEIEARSSEAALRSGT